MQNLTHKLNALMIDFLNLWIKYLDKVWPWVGLLFGICIILSWLNRDNKSARFFSIIAFLALVFQPAFYFAIPRLAIEYANVEFHLPSYHLWAFGIGSLLGIASMIAMLRYFAPTIETIKHRLTKSSSVERNRKTDIREISVHLPNSQKPYDPTKYFNSKKGLFFGLDERKSPVYLAWDKWRSSHCDIVGTSGSGKGVAAGVVLTQAIASGEAVVIVDPKNDEFLPHVMRQAAHAAGVPYVYIDLQAETPQWNPIQYKNAAEIEELLSAGFSLGEKGSDADFYRLDDRRAARIFAQLSMSSQAQNTGINQSATLIQTLQTLIEQQSDIAEAGKKFVSDLEEIGMIAAVNTDSGVNLVQLLKQGAVIYVRGSMRNPRILKLQRIFVLSIMQFIEARDRDTARHVCLFMDEFKYLISRPALEALGAIRDKRAHVIIAHQSLGDLRDCPADLNAESVVASVNENCAIKLAYAVKDPDTADWLARMSGSILVDDETRQVKTNAGLTEVRNSDRTLRQSERNLIDTNMLQALPERCAVLYGAGLAQFFFTSPIIVTKTTAATTPVQLKSASLHRELGAISVSNHSHINTTGGSLPQTIAQSMLDVD